MVRPRKKTGILTETFVGEEGVRMMDRCYGSHIFPWKVDGASDPSKNLRRKIVALKRAAGMPELLTLHKFRRYFQDDSALCRHRPGHDILHDGDTSRQGWTSFIS